MKNKKMLVTGLLLVLVLAAAGILYSRLGSGLGSQKLATTATEATAQPDSADPTEAAQPETVAAADFTVLDGDGNEVKLSDYFGRPIVLNFWAYWCGPCQTEMPEFNAMYEELGGEVVFLMTHVGASVDDGKALVAENGYTFPVIFDTKSEAAAVYGVNAFPTSFFIDPEGNLRAYYVGMMSRELLQTGVDLIYTPQS